MLLFVLLLFYIPLVAVYFYFARKFWRIRSLRLVYLLRAVSYTLWMGGAIFGVGLGARALGFLDDIIVAGLLIHLASYFVGRGKPAPDEERALQDISSEIDHEFLGGPAPKK